MTTRFQAIEYIFIGWLDLQVLLKPYPLHLSIFAYEYELNGIKLYPQIALAFKPWNPAGRERISSPAARHSYLHSLEVCHPLMQAGGRHGDQLEFLVIADLFAEGSRPGM